MAAAALGGIWRKRRGLRLAVKIGIPVVAVLLGIVYLVISNVIAAGLTTAEHKGQEDHPSAYDLEYEDVEFESRGGDITLKGWYLPGEDQRPTIIFVHGITSMRSGDNAVELASFLVPLGFNILMFDLRGHGNSAGTQVSYGYYERQDLLGAFDYLLGRGVPAQRIGVLGMSMGAGTAVLGLAQEPAIQALVADSTYARASDLITKEIDLKTPIPKWIAPVFIPGATLIARLRFDIDIGELVPEEAVADLDYPVLVIHGLADTRIPTEHGVRVHEAAHRDSKIWLVPGVEHVDAFKDRKDEYVERVAAYFEDRLGGQ